MDHRIPIEGRSPTNVTFGPDGETKIYVVEDEHGTLASLDVGVAGLTLCD